MIASFVGSGQTRAELTAANPTLQKGRVVVESDTGLVKRGDGITAWTGLGYWSPAQQVGHKTADQSSTDGTNLADVTQLSFAIEVGGVYIVEYHLFVVAAATTTGLIVALNGPTIGSGYIAYSAHLTGAATAQVNGCQAAYEGLITATDTLSTTVPVHSAVHGYIANGATAGTLALRMKTEVNASAATICRGSWGRCTRVA